MTVMVDLLDHLEDTFGAAHTIPVVWGVPTLEELWQRDVLCIGVRKDDGEGFAEQLAVTDMSGRALDEQVSVRCMLSCTTDGADSVRDDAVRAAEALSAYRGALAAGAEIGGRRAWLAFGPDVDWELMRTEDHKTFAVVVFEITARFA